MIRKPTGAYWIADGHQFTLFVDGHRRAEADVTFNHAVVYGPPRLFRKPVEENLIAGMSAVIVAEIERKLGLGDVPILTKEGASQDSVRLQMQDSARSFENASHQPSPDPRGEAAWMLRKAHSALNEAAVAADLCDGSAAARDLCARATKLLKEHRGISPDAAAAVREAESMLIDAIGGDAVHRNIRLTEARIYLGRAAGLADIYGEKEAMAQDTASQSENQTQELEERAWHRRTSRAFARGF